MTSSGYEHENSGGLMPLIRALIKPPDEESNGQKSKKPQHPYYKRPGKGHNHDTCDACGEGGDLICCDRCPASFHLGCHDPPLEENDIPAGQWLCKECRSSDADKPSSSSSRSSRAQSPSDKSDTDRKARTLRSKREDSTQQKKDEQKNEEQKKDEPEKQPPEEEKDLTPMEVLVRAARIMNPKQFDLPPEMRIPCPFPGTDKDPSKSGNNGGVIGVDAWGHVPLPAKLCHVCQLTCRAAPLLQCDYCPLLFHQDCLDPPLTSLPTGRWMCPNHVEQYIDWKLVNSISATERVALWERFSGPVDQHAIKIDFIRRARNPRPAFRMKVPAGAAGRARVPAMVRAHYARPPPLAPARREYVRCRNVLKQLKESGVYDESEDEEDTPRRKRQICLNLECPQYTGGGRCPHAGPEGSADPPTGRKGSADPQPEGARLAGATQEDAERDLHAIMDEESSESELEDLLGPVKRRKLSADDADKKRASPPLPLAQDAAADAVLALARAQLSRLDARLVALLAWQRLQQVLSGEALAAPWRSAPLSERAAELVARSIDRGKLARLGLRRVALPSELLGREERTRIAAAVWGAPPAPAPRAPPAPRCDAAVRAALTPIRAPAESGVGLGFGRAAPMRGSRLSLGRRGDVGAECARAAPLHAVIFYDEVTRHFELLNYSPLGTRVDGVLYTTAPAAAPAAPAPVAALRAVLRRRRRPRGLNGLTTAASAPEGSLECHCGSLPSPPPDAAWEGTALLSHGSLIQVGCQQYVFSIMDEVIDEEA